MTFDEILEQVIILLKRQGRVSYPALKIRFSLDDDYLEALKAEIIEAQQLAIDENGRVLVWVGNTEAASSSAVPPPQIPQQPAAQETQPTHEPPLGSRPREAERRQLTVMFCDLVDSTKLSSQLDPEDYREVVREYQRVCTEVIQRYDGHIAQYLGDGLLVYFGYPQSHEDEAQRAVYTGLGILNTLKQLNVRLKQDKGIRLALRIGIHTGLVVVGDIGEGSRQEQLALGETPNIAARIQGLAAPDSVVISDATYRLIQGYFACQELGEQVLRGVSQPITTYQVLQESGIQSRLDVASTRGLTPLVGRESEVTLLLERWQQARDGQGQVILLSGEAGIGKSRLVQVLKDSVAEKPHTRWECRSSPYYQNSALYPIIDLIQRTLRWQQDDTPEARLEKLERQLSQYRLPLTETIPLFAPLLSLPIPDDRYPPLNFSPQRQRQKTLENIVVILLELAERQPVLFILEDLHWIDPTTLEFLGLLVEQVPTAAIYTLLTCRPHFQPVWHHRSYLTEITVNRLSRNQIEQMATQVAGGKTLPTEIVQQLVDKTDGVPLFVEEITKALLESGHLKEMNGRYELTGTLPALAIPSTLQDSLMARLDKLMTAKGIAQLGAVIGRQFSYELLQAVSQLDEATLQRELRRLVDAELLYQRGLPPHATYTFKHALIQDTAHAFLLHSTRQGYHRHIAEVVAERFPETAANQPELLAHHYTEAGLNEQAVGYWQKAGQRAIERSANTEAIAHLSTGLALLTTLPETPARAQQELMLHISFAVPLVALKGQAAPEVERVHTRAQELCQQVGDTSQLIPVLWGLYRWYGGRAEYERAQDMAEHIMRLADELHDPTLYVAGNRALGGNFFLQGGLVSARTHLEQSLALYGSAQHRSQVFHYAVDHGVACRTLLTWTLWILGYPDQAAVKSHEMLILAQELAHLPTLVFALHGASLFHQFRREVQSLQEQAGAVILLATEQGFALFDALGRLLQGWAQSVPEAHETSIRHMHQGLADYRATDIEIFHPYFLGLLAEVYGQAQQPAEGLALLIEALALVDKTGQRFYEAELHRLKGALLLQLSSDNHPEAESYFHQAIAIAQSQQAKSWELRAATSLAKLWQRQGKRQDAYDLLAPVYGWFTEGFDTADLKDAKALLDELA